jgi:DNA-binding GntR family transcriptional regulator
MPPLASAASRAALKRTLSAHRAIYEALKARDAETAAELISAHIHSAWQDRKRRRP